MHTIKADLEVLFFFSVTVCVGKHPWERNIYCVVITGIKTIIPARHLFSVDTKQTSIVFH